MGLKVAANGSWHGQRRTYRWMWERKQSLMSLSRQIKALMACIRISRYLDGRMRVDGISMTGRVRLGETRRCRTESLVLGPNETQANFVPILTTLVPVKLPTPSPFTSPLAKWNSNGITGSLLSSNIHPPFRLVNRCKAGCAK